MSEHGTAADHDTDLGRTGRRLGPTSYVLIGLVIGLLLGIGLLWAVRGNPFSAANEVRYTDVVVGSVTEEADRICWAEEPGRRDSPQLCAILALDPELDVPEPGDPVTIGLVDLHTPDGGELTQVVHVAPAETDVLDLETEDLDGTEGVEPTDEQS